MGGNMGDRQVNLDRAMAAIQAQIGPIRKASARYETAAWGIQDQPDFLNQVLWIETSLSPVDLLNSLLAIEQEMGRYRTEKYGPRTIDLDILLYGSWIIHLPGLQVPHPRMSQRRFVMTPMAEIAPQLKHPVLQRSMESLLGDCPDPLPVHKLNPPVHNNA